jgi:putative addiction module component (TIGR02574 family)
MDAVIDKLTEQALALPSDARARLVDRLVESLDPSTGGKVQALWVAEATRRRDEVRSGAVKPVSREETRERMRRIFR